MTPRTRAALVAAAIALPLAANGLIAVLAADQTSPRHIVVAMN